jgi:hypothetical protein
MSIANLIKILSVNVISAAKCTDVHSAWPPHNEFFAIKNSTKPSRDPEGRGSRVL